MNDREMLKRRVVLVEGCWFETEVEFFFVSLMATKND